MSFKVVALFLETSPPAFGPRVEDAVPVLQCCYGGDLICNSILQCLQRWKSHSPEIFFKSAIQPKVTWGKVRGVSWMREMGPTKLIDEIDS